MPLITLLLIVIGVLLIGVGGLVLLRDPRRVTNISFFGLSASGGAWAIGIGGFLAVDAAQAALNWSKFFYLAPLFIALSLVVFTDVFPRSTKLNRKKLFLATAGLIAMAVPLLAVPDFLTQRITYHPWGKQVVLETTQYYIYAAYIAICFGTSIYVTYQKVRQETGVYRAQVVSFLQGFGISAVAGVTFNLLLPGLSNYRFIALGPLAGAFYILTTAYSIVRHRMFNIRLVIARSLGYILSLAVIAFGYGFVVFGTAKVLFDVNIPFGTQLFLSLATGFASLSFGKLKVVFDRFTNTLFYRDAYDPQDLFDSLNKLLVSTLNIDKLALSTTQLLATNLKAEFCLIGLKEIANKSQRVIGTQRRNISPADIAAVRKFTVHYHNSVIATDYIEDEQYAELKAIMQRNDIAVLVRLAPRLSRNEEGLGYLVFGPKKSGNPYTHEDFRVLDTVANELIIAIQNALHFEEIQNFNVTLQQKVVEATNKLRRTNEKLKAMDETKDDFISMASHQLRTPLTSVKGYLSMVLEGDAGKINKVQREMLGQAFFSSQRMVYLIADLLNVSRLKTGKFVMEPTQVNLAEMVQQEMSQLEETASAKNLTLKYDKPENFPDVMLDETKIRQVIMNFMDNAIYYTPKDGHIEIRLTDTGPAVEMRIIDDGIGVPKSEQHHLFTKLYRAANARKARPDGTGLGLFMAKKVIVGQSGAVIFESQEGKGSTFGFMFSKSKIAIPAQTDQTA